MCTHQKSKFHKTLIIHVKCDIMTWFSSCLGLILIFKIDSLYIAALWGSVHE